MSTTGHSEETSEAPVPEDAEEQEYDDDDAEEVELKAGVRSTIRAKWTMDGATTLTGAAEALRHLADELVAMEADGWQLMWPVEDDYGTIRRHPVTDPHPLAG